MKYKQLNYKEWIEIILLIISATGFYMTLLLILAFIFDNILPPSNFLFSLFLIFSTPLFIVICMLNLIIRGD